MKKKILIPVVVAFICVILFWCLDLQSVEDYYSGQDGKAQKQTVYMTIRCDTVLDNYDKLDESLRSEKYVPEDGMILKRTKVAFEEGDTVFDVLVNASKEHKIQLDYDGADKNSYGTVYVKGINQLYEMSCGELSGWVFLLNGEKKDNGASAFDVQDGDEIEWVYTCDLGRDVESSGEEGAR